MVSVISVIPLQQFLNDFKQADQNFFKSTQGNRKVKPIRLSKFKIRKSKETAIFTKGGLTETKNGQVGQHKNTAKVTAACEMSTR